MLIMWDAAYCESQPPRKQGVVVPDCCEDVQRHMTVILAYKWEDLSDRPAIIQKPVPEGLDWKGKINHMFSTIEDDPEGRTVFEAAKPRWFCSGADFDLLSDRYTGNMPRSTEREIHFCPHCGTKLPEVERVPKDELPGPIHRPAYDGDVCATCKQDAGDCACFRPELGWRTVVPEGVGVLDLGVRAAAVLENLNIQTLTDLTALPALTLLKERGSGLSVVNEVQQALSKKGLSLQNPLSPRESHEEAD